MGALAGFPDVDLCLRTFDLAMTEVRSQNGFAVLGSLLANSVGNQAVWTRLTENWEATLDRFPKNAPPRIIESIPALCGDAEFAEGAVARVRPSAGGPVCGAAPGQCGIRHPRAGRAGRIAQGGRLAHLLMSGISPGNDALDSARVQELFETARQTRGFMPDDEGEALFAAALRAGQAALPAAAPTTFVEIGAWCGKSTVYLGAAAEARDSGKPGRAGARVRPRRVTSTNPSLQHRPPPRLGGEPTRMGVPRTGSGRSGGGSSRHAAALAPDHDPGRARVVRGRHRRRLPHAGDPLGPPAGLLLH